jgi:ABC-type transport system involved in multi-copper enzyme maturation permease subunit
MIRLVQTEFLKLRTTPALYVTLGLTALLSVVSVITTILLAGQGGAAPLGTAANANKTLQVGAVTSMVMLVVGILVIAGEHRQRTILGTYLAEPRRGRVLIGKLLTVGALGAVVGAVTFGVALAVAVPVYAAKGIHHLPIHLVSMFTGAVLASTVFGLLGVAIGAGTRNTVAAIVGSLIWVQLIEVGILQNAFPSLGKWLPAGAGVAVTSGTGGSATTLSPLMGAVVLIGWATVIAVAATVLTARKEPK